MIKNGIKAYMRHRIVGRERVGFVGAGEERRGGPDGKESWDGSRARRLRRRRRSV